MTGSVRGGAAGGAAAGGGSCGAMASRISWALRHSGKPSRQTRSPGCRCPRSISKRNSTSDNGPYCFPWRPMYHSTAVCSPGGEGPVVGGFEVIAAGRTRKLGYGHAGAGPCLSIDHAGIGRYRGSERLQSTRAGYPPDAGCHSNCSFLSIPDLSIESTMILRSPLAAWKSIT